MKKITPAFDRARAVLRQDRAENSIMQTISIAVSAILIAAGLITAPSLINNARDVNAKSDLANLAYAQEYFLAEKGTYATSVGALKSVSGTELPGGVKLTLSLPDGAYTVTGTATAYTLQVTSASTKKFSRTSASTEIQTVTP